MNEQISWDHSLVKKYSSSNHYKLLNQLRNEVKKYPINKKKNISSNIRNDSKIQTNDNLIKSSHQDFSISKNSDINKETKDSLYKVSFNNSKNFSIYNSINNDSEKEQGESKSLDNKHSNEDSSFSSFKDRLNQIDMK